MGRIRKITSLGFDMSSTEAAPVSAAGEMRVRPKSSGATLQLSYNGGAWFDVGTGGAGSTSISSTWKWSTATAGTPASGYMLCDNTSPGSATLLSINETSNTSTDFSAQLATVQAGDTFYIQDSTDATKWVRYTATAGGTDVGPNWLFPVSVSTAGTTTFTNDTVMNVVITTGGSGTTSVRLDQVLDPQSNKAFNMSTSSYRLGFDFPGIVPASGGVWIKSSSASANTSNDRALLWLSNTPGADAAHLLTCQLGTATDYPFIIAKTGRIGMGGTDANYRTQIYPLTGTDGSLYVNGGIRVDLGSDIAGDMFYRDAAPHNLARIPIGSVGQVLTVGAGSVPGWAAGATAPRLDQVADPAANKTFNMSTSNYRLGFQFPGVLPFGGGMWLESTNTVAGGDAGGTLLWIKNSGTTGTPANLLACQIGSATTYPLAVFAGGKVSMGADPGALANYRVNINTLAGTDGSLYVNGGVRLDLGSDIAGDMFYRDAAPHNLKRIPAGAVGDVLTMGASSVPGWAATSLRLDQIADPNTNKTFNMSSYKLGFEFPGVVPATGGIWVKSSSASANTSDDRALVWISNTPGTDAAHLLTCQIGTATDYPLIVSKTGRIGMGGTAANYRVQMYPLTGTDGSLYVNGGVRFDIGSDSFGDTYYKGSSGNLTRIPVGSVGQVLTVGPGFVPGWGAAAGGGSPGSPVSTLQWNNAGSFAAVTDSVVGTGGNVTLSSYLQLRASTSIDQEFFISATTGLATRFVMRAWRDSFPASPFPGFQAPYILFERGRNSEASKSTIISGDICGQISFHGWFSGSNTTPLGILKTHYDSFHGGVITVGSRSGANARLEVTDNLSSLIGITASELKVGSDYVQVRPSSIRVSIGDGTAGAIFYQLGGSSGIAALAPGTNGHVLTLSGGLPVWAAAAGGLSMPAGSSELLYRNAGAIGLITSSTVSGANITLGGSFAVQTSKLAVDSSGYVGIGAAPLAGYSASVVNRLRVSDSASSDNHMIFFEMAQTAQVYTYFQRFENSTSPETPISIFFNRGRAATTAMTNLDYIGALYFRGYRAASGGQVAWNELVTQYNGTGGRFIYTSRCAATSGLHVTDQNVLLSYSTAAAGYGSRREYQLQSNNGTIRQAAALDVRWQDAVDSTYSGVMSLRTIHKGGPAWTNPVSGDVSSYRERMVLGGYKDLVHNTATTLFTITFNSTDVLMVCGEIHFMVVTKEPGGAYFNEFRKVAFTINHTSVWATTGVHFKIVGATSTTNFGAATWQHSVNTQAGVNIPAHNAAGGDIGPMFDASSPLGHSVSYKMLLAWNGGSWSQSSVFYNIFYTGEADITLA